MKCEDFADNYELYALGALDREEQAAFEQHLAEGCANCEAALRNARSINAVITAALAPDAEPSRGLRSRVAASAGASPPKSWGWLGWAAAAASLVLAAFLISQLRTERGEREQAQAQLGQAGLETARLRAALDFLNEPETRLVGFGAGQTQPPRGNVFVNPRRGVMLIAANLPALQAGRIYQMWLIPKSGAPRPAGLFRSDPGGAAVHLLSGPLDLAQTGAVAVSVEPEAGSAAPTTTPIIVAPVAE